jgi:hypothetical protein
MITLAGYSFEGPFSHTWQLKSQSGVYAILTPSGQGVSVLDVGESGNVRQRIENHDRKSCWSRYANSGNILYAVYYTPGQSEAQRQRIEKAIRDAYEPPCGKI